MRSRFVMVLFFVFAATFTARAQGVCDAALVKSTYNSFSSDHLDWRLATLVTQKEYDDIKQEEGANAVIYGIPVGESYKDYQTHLKEKLSSYHESLTHDQIVNILWTGLDPNSPSAYRDCLNAQIFAARGLHMAVVSATKSDVSVIVSWNPQGSDPSRITPRWTWHGAGAASLPSALTQGSTTVVLPRPDIQRTLAINYPGFTSSAVLEPLAKLPPLPAPAPWVVVTETYKSDNAASGACKDYGAWASVCSPDKPEGWTIVSYHFDLTGDRAGCQYAKCDVASPPTPTKICYHFQTQGHDEECGHSGNTGIHYSTGVLTVVWQHH